nr:MAG TPA: hypothetical protein [Caudoviricetes sp.]
MSTIYFNHFNNNSIWRYSFPSFIAHTRVTIAKILYHIILLLFNYLNIFDNKKIKEIAQTGK